MPTTAARSANKMLAIHAVIKNERFLLMRFPAPRVMTVNTYQYAGAPTPGDCPDCSWWLTLNSLTGRQTPASYTLAGNRRSESFSAPSSSVQASLPCGHSGAP